MPPPVHQKSLLDEHGRTFQLQDNVPLDGGVSRRLFASIIMK